MAEREFIGLDNPAFSGRLRQPTAPHIHGQMSDFLAHPNSSRLIGASLAPPTRVRLERRFGESPDPRLRHAARRRAHGTPEPVGHVPQRSVVLHRRAVQQPEPPKVQQTDEPAVRAETKRYGKVQMALVGMAGFVFALGVWASVDSLRTNHDTSAQAAALAKAAINQPATPAGSSNSGAPAPNNQKPSAAAVAAYTVGPQFPRYLDIPTLGIHTRVLSLGILNSGALATPNNSYDVGWYNESSLPGKPGAMLIDGHVSAWMTPGVFYGLKDLNPGDRLSIQRGDGKTLDYKVVKTIVYDADHVDMRTALQPVDSSKPGLNLITCDGTYQSANHTYDRRLLVMAEQI